MYKKPGIVKFIISTQSKKIKKQIKIRLLKNDHYVIIKNDYSLREIKLLPQNIRFDFLILHYDRMSMTNTTLIKYVKQLKQKYADINILVITEDNTLKHIQLLCSAGVDGFLIMQEINKLHEAIDTVLSGKRYMNQVLLNCLLQNKLAKGSDTYDDHFAVFNLKEHQVFQLIHAGYSEDIITEILDISLEEVLSYKKKLNNKKHKIHLCRKL